MIAGFQFKPIIPTKLVNTGPISYVDTGVTFTLKPRFGYSFGMVIRKSFSKTFSLETGINLVKRHYQIKIDDNDSLFNLKADYEITGYEMPLQGLVYVQINDYFYVNGSAGFSFNFLPADVYSSNDDYEQATIRRSWVQSALIANFGIEYRTENSGSFYIGASYLRPFKNIAVTHILYKHYAPQKSSTFDTNLNGDYLTLDLRYFFPINKKH